MGALSSLPNLPVLTRRNLLVGAGTCALWAGIPRFARAAGRDPRLVVIVLRGALDGLAAVPPVGDPAYPALRTDLAIGVGGRATQPLDGFFALNDAMPTLLTLYHAKQATIVHAAATPYRDRSHFDGQDVLENGTPTPRGASTGWLNRAVAAIPSGGRAKVSGLAAGPTIPLIMRGSAPVLSWTPPDFKAAPDDLEERLLALYRHSDHRLAEALGEAQDLSAMAAGGGKAAPRKGTPVDAAFRRLAAGVGHLLADDNGPRVAAIAYDGWDTHVREGASGGRLATYLGALDGAIDALRASLQPVWNQTAVVAVTEFGRTARENGSAGTDHGTATTAFLFGGAVRGGRVLADWPGLKPSQLYQDRDLAPTTDVRAILKGVLRDHLGLAERVLAERIFPGSAAVRGTSNLLV